MSKWKELLNNKHFLVEKFLNPKSLFSITIFILLLLLTIPINGKTIIVDNSNENNASNIQEVVDTANIGDTILIRNGEYTESFLIDKSITIKGETPGNTIINGQNLTAITLDADEIILYNLTITNASTAILLRSSHCTLYNITFLENDVAINISELNQNNVIYQNNFINNQIHVIDHSNQTSWSLDSIGNYWDDYTGIDADNNNIGDSAYFISANVSDPFPVMTPVTIPPIADFFSSPANPNTQTVISFTDLSTDPDGSIMLWNWSFDDGSFSTEKEPTHQYADDGTYTIRLKVTDNLGVSNSESYTLNVRNTAPTVFFTFHPKVPLDIQEVDFRDNSTDVDGSIAKRNWFINNTLFDETSMFRYTFPDDGEYTVTLTVTDDDGDNDSYSETISVQNVAPSAGFTYSTENDNLSKNKPINFQDTSNDVDGSIISYYWDFGDGTTSTDKNPSHSYDADGRYKITLSITDNDGKTDSYGKQIQVGITENPEGFLSVLSLSDIIIIVIIFAALITVFIVSKKYSFGE